MHTRLYNFNNVLAYIHKLPHVSVLAGPSSGSVKLYKTIKHYQLQNVELSKVRKCIIYREGCVKSNWSSL